MSTKPAIARIALLFLSVLLAACSSETPQVAEVRPVRTVIVDPRPIEDDRRAVGEVRPRFESDIGFRVSGKVISRSVDVGVSVKKGDVIARLDDQDPKTRIRSAESDVVSAEAVLTEATNSEERTVALLEKGVTTRARYDAAVRDRRSAEARVTAAKAALSLARDQLVYTELKAEFDGIVTAVSAEPGQVVAVGQTIAKLARPEARDAVFNIAEAALRDRKPDDRPQIIVTLLSNPSIEAEGVVREVSPVADATTRTYQVKVTLNDQNEQFRFGTSVMGRLKATSAPVVVLPASALFDKGGKPAVWVVDATANKVALKPVVVARYESDRVIISDGLARGEVVVTAGVNRLREGQPIRLIAGAGP